MDVRCCLEWKVKMAAPSDFGVDVRCVEWKVPVPSKSSLDWASGPTFKVLRNDCSLALRRCKNSYELLFVVSSLSTPLAQCFEVFTELRNDETAFTEKALVRKRRQVIWKCSEDDVTVCFPADGRPQLLHFRVFFKLDKFFPLADPDQELSPGEALKQSHSRGNSYAGSKRIKTSEEATHRMSYQNIPDCLKILSADLLELYQDSLHHDVKLLWEGQIILAHRNILSARSKLFRDKLQSEDHQNGCLLMQGEPYPLIQTLVKYIYTGSLSTLTVESATALSAAADKYAIGALKDRCDNFLKNPMSSQNDCNCLQSLSVDLHELYKDESGHDVKLLCGGGWESASANRSILSARSDVFRTLLENQDGRTDDSIEVKDMDINVLQQFLRYIYTGILPEMTKDLAEELLKAADSYEIAALRARCEDFLRKHESDDV